MIFIGFFLCQRGTAKSGGEGDGNKGRGKRPRKKRGRTEGGGGGRGTSGGDESYSPGHNITHDNSVSDFSTGRFCLYFKNRAVNLL